MAIVLQKTVGQLDAPYVLTPERYNPNRGLSFSSGTRLQDIAFLGDSQVFEKAQESVFQIDTCDAHDGVLSIPDMPSLIKSNKKRIQFGDVIISRLRPYLKQIAFVDSRQEGLACSTEFYVLRSKDERSIAFLVPFLLSDSVQLVFASSVEGSQHPRFKEKDLMNLMIPEELLTNRDRISAEVEAAVVYYRHFLASLKAEVAAAESLLSSTKSKLA